MSKGRQVPPEVVDAIRDIVHYDWDKEEEDYQEQCYEHELDPSSIPDLGHVFESLVVVRRWLEQDEKGYHLEQDAT